MICAIHPPTPFAAFYRNFAGSHRHHVVRRAPIVVRFCLPAQIPTASWRTAFIVPFVPLERITRQIRAQVSQEEP